MDASTADLELLRPRSFVDAQIASTWKLNLLWSAFPARESQTPVKLKWLKSDSKATFWGWPESHFGVTFESFQFNWGLGLSSWKRRSQSWTHSDSWHSIAWQSRSSISSSIGAGGSAWVFLILRWGLLAWTMTYWRPHLWGNFCGSKYQKKREKRQRKADRRKKKNLETWSSTLWHELLRK